jgi:putative molybdopterin biosynthesis protein
MHTCSASTFTDSGTLASVQHIQLAYSWLLERGNNPTRNPTSPLKNPLMDLLQAVRSSGSISGAAKALNLSYRHVWGELRRWEAELGQALIIWEKGQAARLTAFADKLLWAERQAQARLAPQISALQAELEKTFALAFDPEHHLLTLYASHDDALVSLREHAAQQGLHLDMRFCGSVDAIRALNEGRCTMAGFHAPMQPSPTGLVARTYKPLLRTGRHKIIGFASREQGLMVPKGNPLGLSQWSDVLRPGLRLANRTLGTGTRLLLDDWLGSQGLDGSTIAGYAHAEPSHAAVAARIASGQADVGLGIASAAHLQGLDFVPLMQENYWLVCLKSALDTPPVQALRKLVGSDTWCQLLLGHAGYSMHAHPGQVQSLKAQLPWWA